MRTMDTAPKDGTDIEVFSRGKWWGVSYQDCEWLREGDDGDPSILDAWEIVGGDGPGHIELDEAEGWRPAPNLN